MEGDRDDMLCCAVQVWAGGDSSSGGSVAILSQDSFGFVGIFAHLNTVLSTIMIP